MIDRPGLEQRALRRLQRRQSLGCQVHPRASAQIRVHVDDFPSVRAPTKQSLIGTERTTPAHGFEMMQPARIRAPVVERASLQSRIEVQTAPVQWMITYIHSRQHERGTTPRMRDEEERCNGWEVALYTIDKHHAFTMTKASIQT